MAEILSGWKDIANYMRKGVRTVQRYGRELGLPVRRASGKPKSSVLVTKAELDLWIHAAFNHEASQEELSVDFEKLRLRTSELMAGLERLKESMNNLTKARDELTMSRTTVRPTVHRVQETVFQTRVHPKNGNSRSVGPPMV